MNVRRVQKQEKAFTLIELLVVIAIIGLLATLATVAFGKSRMKARDTKRLADIKMVQTALRLYYDDNGEYPHLDSWSLSSYNSANWVPNLVAGGYLTKLPVDPINNARDYWLTGNYSYGYNSFAEGNYQDYNLMAQLEDPSNPNRCELKCWKFYTDGATARTGQVWCGNSSSNCTGTQNYSIYLYADH